LAAVLGFGTLAARAGDAAIRVSIHGEDTLPRSAHVGVSVTVELAADTDAPLLLTPSVEGTAVEIVRGRLMRSDAKRLDAHQLRFEVPVIARSEGTAILRVEVSSYVCAPRCRQVSGNASRVLHVR
jgi:hypothetical protein